MLIWIIEFMSGAYHMTSTHICGFNILSAEEVGGACGNKIV